METWKIKKTPADSAVDFETIIGIPILDATGVGMPPVSNVVSQYANSDGGYFQSSLVGVRDFILIAGTPAQDEVELHAIRGNLISYLNRDRSATPDQPCVIQYVKNGVTLELEAYYDGGMEFTSRKMYVERIPIRFIAPNPYWKSATQTVTSLNFGTSIPAAGSTVIANDGDALAWPVIEVTGPGKILQIRNDTTDKEFDLDVTLDAGEIVTFDLSPGAKTIVSNINGTMVGYLTIPTDLGKFALIPGNNTIKVAINNGSAAAEIQYYDTYWSIDGVA